MDITPPLPYKLEGSEALEHVRDISLVNDEGRNAVAAPDPGVKPPCTPERRSQIFPSSQGVSRNTLGSSLEELSSISLLNVVSSLPETVTSHNPAMVRQREEPERSQSEGQNSQQPALLQDRLSGSLIDLWERRSELPKRRLTYLEFTSLDCSFSSDRDASELLSDIYETILPSNLMTLAITIPTTNVDRSLDAVWKVLHQYRTSKERRRLKTVEVTLKSTHFNVGFERIPKILSPFENVLAEITDTKGALFKLQLEYDGTARHYVAERAAESDLIHTLGLYELEWSRNVSNCDLRCCVLRTCV
ncbi:hypothetical protein C8Q80DRAFT_260959 [Daedaleopsis nitida]|nr:hypothetical protein C8Q80DRAFT_260959 [Daedaleopsis nitida]